jgi:ABC-type glycerol-3-phosphate transport system substrate-binding protein
MKKTLTVLIAAGALLGAAGCTATPQLSNEETCARVKTVVSAQSATSDKAGMTRVANQLRPIEAVASGDLQAPLQTIIEYFDESAKPTPDTARLEEMKADYTAAGQAYGQVCGNGQ